jgi:hypothetical protein
MANKLLELLNPKIQTKTYCPPLCGWARRFQVSDGIEKRFGFSIDDSARQPGL